MKKEITADDIKVALSNQYKDGWMFFTEVKQPTKWKTKAWVHDFPENEYLTRADWGRMEKDGSKTPKARIIDVYVVAVRGSEEATAIGFEIKVSRNDFVNERYKSKKYQAWLPYCDKFYFVCPKGLVTEYEIPEECGLIEVNRYGRGFQRNVIIEAPRRSISRPPWHLMVRLIRRIYNEMWRLNWQVYYLKQELRKSNQLDRKD